MKLIFKDIDAVVLCGGQGTRLRPVVTDKPKVLASFGKSTFLDILIDSLQKNGFGKFVFCIGYMKDQIKNHFKHRDDIFIFFSEEDEPLGTGGALKKARPLITSETFVVMNGDSICDIDYPEFFRFHKNKKAVLSMALVQMKETQDFGSVVMNDLNEITSFKEKVTDANPCLVNAGVYFMQKEIFSYMPEKNHFSLENDFFPSMIGGRCVGFITNSELIDIGTPERYEKAVHLIGGNK
jgi:D-glycero-alpha-D-manno-heptose 1-phosphate guanylyltransferase